MEAVVTKTRWQWDQWFLFSARVSWWNLFVRCFSWLLLGLISRQPVATTIGSMQLLRTLTGDVKNCGSPVHPWLYQKKRWGWCRFPCLLVCISKIDLWASPNAIPEFFFNVAIQHPKRAFDDHDPIHLAGQVGLETVFFGIKCWKPSTFWAASLLRSSHHVTFYPCLLLCSVSSAAWNGWRSLPNPLEAWKNPMSFQRFYGSYLGCGTTLPEVLTAEVVNVRPPILVSTNLVKARIYQMQRVWTRKFRNTEWDVQTWRWADVANF